MNYTPPVYTIPLKQIDDYTELMRFCRKKNIQFYVYEFVWLQHTLKYGIQHKCGGSGNDYGERVYTQAGHMPGWSKSNLKRSPSTKEDIQEIINKVQLTFNCIFHKDDVVLKIMDYTNAPFELDTPRAELQRIEDDLSDAHEDTFGYRPIGNKTKSVGKKIPLLMTTNLFDWG